MISPLLIYNKFRYHTYKIRLEKLVPLNYRFPTDNKKRQNEIDQTVFKLDFWQKSGFPKNRGLVSGSPPGGFIFPEMTPRKKSGNAIKHKQLSSFFLWLPFLCIFIDFLFPPPSIGPRAKKEQKNSEKLTNRFFHKNCFFHNSG